MTRADGKTNHGTGPQAARIPGTAFNLANAGTIILISTANKTHTTMNDNTAIPIVTIPPFCSFESRGGRSAGEMIREATVRTARIAATGWSQRAVVAIEEKTGTEVVPGVATCPKRIASLGAKACQSFHHVSSGTVDDASGKTDPFCRTSRVDAEIEGVAGGVGRTMFEGKEGSLGRESGTDAPDARLHRVRRGG